MCVTIIFIVGYRGQRRRDLSNALSERNSFDKIHTRIVAVRRTRTSDGLSNSIFDFFPCTYDRIGSGTRPDRA